MPKLYLPVPELEKSIVRPVMLDIVRQVRDMTNIPADVKIIFLSDARSSPQNGSKQSEEIMDNTSISGSNRITFEVTEQYSPDYMGTLAIAQTEQIPIFIDHELGVVLKPIYTSRIFDINIRYRDHSRTRVKAWRDDIYMHINHMRDVNIHTADYHYSIPSAFLALVKEIHRLRENVAGYGQDFEDYFFSCISNRNTEITNLVGDNPLFAIAERQTRIQGLFDFTEAPEKESSDDTINKWVSNFTYRVTIDIPTGVHVQYPVMIHNQLLDEKYIPKLAFDEDKHEHAFSRSLKALHRFEATKAPNGNSISNKTIHEPEYDDWWPDNQLPDSSFVFTALCELLPDDLRLIIDLNELGNYSIDEEILEYFRKVEYPYLTKAYQSPYHISLYRDKFLANEGILTVNSKLEYRASSDLSLRRNYRFALSMITDISSINVQAFRRMRRYPSVLRKTLKAMQVTKGELTRHAPNIDLTKYAADLPDVGPSKAAVYDHLVRMRTVLSSYVMVRNINEKHTGKLEDYDFNKAPLVSLTGNRA